MPKSLKDIRTSLITRGLSLARASIKASWTNQLDHLIQELGQLKGTAMKVGQTLSMYGENLLPKEVNDLLKKLQQDSPPLDWPGIQKVLEAELGPEKLKELEINETAIAAASIGQVHKATIRSTGEVLALKVQYPGIDQAVATDLKLIKFLLSLSDLVPRGPRMDQIFTEIAEMFQQEVDYTREKEFADIFAEKLKGDSRYAVPKVFARYSTRKVVAYEFMPGERVDSPNVQALSQERRNRVGIHYLSLYLRELLDLKLMQTDPHLGNYLLQIDPNGDQDRLVLLDFGAVREVPEDFLKHYAKLVEGGINRDERQIEKAARALGLLQPGDSVELVRQYLDLCFALVEPFQGDIYDWGASDLPKRVAGLVSKIAVGFKLRAPPRELVFLDRKLGGVFIFLSVLKCKMQPRELVLNAVQDYFKNSEDQT